MATDLAHKEIVNSIITLTWHRKEKPKQAELWQTEKQLITWEAASIMLLTIITIVRQHFWPKKTF